MGTSANPDLLETLEAVLAGSRLNWKNSDMVTCAGS
jgi:hypothetical protein